MGGRERGVAVGVMALRGWGTPMLPVVAPRDPRASLAGGNGARSEVWVRWEPRSGSDGVDALAGSAGKVERSRG